MTVIIGKENKSIAYIYSNCIVSLPQSDVMGVVLGNCVYNKSGRLRGKLIHQTIYTTKGEKVAIWKPSHANAGRIDESKLKRQSWTVLDSIKSYDAPWIEPNEKWSDSSLEELLNS